MHKRTTIWVAGLWSLLFGTAAHALSLGDIEVYSALNQPLEAEILLTSVRAGETEGMLVRLASEEAFVQAGVERPFYLTKIKFRLESKPDGTQYILATTDNPVREPFLSFLVDIDWPRGHLVREYTVLLDPPVFTGASQMPSQTAALPAVTDGESAVGEPALIEREEDDGLTDALPDIELVDELGAVPADAAVGATVDQVAGQADTVETGIDQIGVADEPAFEEIPGAEVPIAEDPLFAQDLPQDMPADSTGIAELDETDDSLSTRLQHQPLPDIDFTFDESLPYDVARTEALLSEFGISLSSMRAAREGSAEPAADRADSHEVQGGDTLWEIAERNKDSDVSVQQAMLAILRYNPNGFIRNNINDVKKGFVLRIPERQAMLEISRQEAAAEVKRQYALWREYRGELAGITSTQQDAVAADRQTQADTTTRGTATAGGGQLSILAPGRDAASTSRSSGAQEGKEKGGSATELDLQLAREQLEAERLEKTELQSRLTDLTGQIETMQRLLTLKDEQLAKLQERLRQLEAAAKTAPTPAPAPAESKTGPEAEAGSEPPSGVTDKSAAKKTPLSEQMPDFETEVKPGPVVVPAPDIAGSAPQPDTTTPDTTTETPATGDLEKLNESPDISLQPDIAADPKVKKPKSKKREVAPKGGKSYLERLNAVLQPVQGFLRDLAKQYIKKPPYNKMADDLLATPAGLGILAAVLIFILVLLVTLVRSLGKVKDKVKEKKPKKVKPAPVIIGSEDHLQTVQPGSTVKLTAKKPQVSLSERLKKVFAPFAGMLAKKPKQAKAESSEEDGIAEAAAAEEDLATAVKEAAVEAKSKTKTKVAKAAPVEDLGQTVVIKPVAKAAPAAASAEEEISDDTTAEADVYLAYGLFDQAEELLKHALASNPGASHYRGKLLETYFAAGKKDEFERLAAELHKSIGNRSSRIWDKAIAMGKEIAPANPLFSGAADSGLKASDFAPAKPETADLDLGESGGATTPDIDFGEVGATETALDLDISGAFDKTLIADGDETMIMDTNSPMLADNDDRTLIADDRTLIVDETSLDAMQERKKDVTDSELNINFDADDLGLGAEELEAAEPPTEATMAMDIALDIDNIDGITDVDNNSGASAADDLIAELGGDDSELSLDGATDTEFDLPEDDDTIIDAGDDTMSGDSGTEDEVSTKLDLARAYMDMGDYDGASSTLEEVLSEGNDKQKREAEELLDQIN